MEIVGWTEFSFSLLSHNQKLHIVVAVPKCCKSKFGEIVLFPF